MMAGSRASNSLAGLMRLYTADVRRVLADPAARGRLVEANLPLVIRIARDYRHRGLPLLDLIQEGNVGLIAAARAFDPGRGVPFGAYARAWIRTAMRDALDRQVSLIVLPFWVFKEMRRHGGPAATCSRPLLDQARRVLAMRALSLDESWTFGAGDA